MRAIFSMLIVAMLLGNTAALADGMIPLRPLSGTYSAANDMPLRSTVSPATTTNSYPALSGYPYTTANNIYSSPTLQGNIISIPDGTNVVIRLNDPISSQTARVGDSVSATLEGPIIANGQVVVPAGSDVKGSVTFVSEAGRFGKHGELEVRFYTITTPNGEAVSIDGGIITNNGTSVLKGDTYKMDIAKGLGIAALGTGVGAVGGTAVGGIVGAAGSGAAIGTAIGAVGGIGYAALREGKGVVLAKGTHLNVQLKGPSAVAGSSQTY